MHHSIILVTSLLLLLFFSGCGGRFQSPESIPSANGTIPSLSPGEHSFTLTQDGENRSYLVYVPPLLGKNPPIILNFHGGGGNADGHVKISNMNEVADEHGFVVVYPNGTPAGSGFLQSKIRTWNAGICCGVAAEQNVDDVGFVKKLLEELKTKMDYDESRVYATGYSNGGFLSYRLACELSDKITAIAPIAASIGIENCNPSRNVPILHVHGEEDPCILYNGGECGGCLGQPFGVCESVPQTIQYFSEKYECSPTEQTQDGCTWYADCNEGVSVGYCPLENVGHVWPGGGKNPLSEKVIGKNTTSFNANERIWTFFQQYRIE